MFMDSQRWDRVQDIFLAASQLDGHHRENLIQSKCGDDKDLADEVRSLLQASASGDNIDAIAESWLGKALSSVENTSLIGQRVGPYKVIRELGVGGMAVVYLAERDDDQFQHQVALKVMKRDHGDGADLLRRFLSERQIMARLAHPNIAHLYDGGVLPDGSPYFVMEYVEGVRLDQACDAGEMTIEERIQVFLKVCEAVQHAHGNLVVHRDLKPSNILVTKEGRPRLLDFGIAKIIAERMEDQTDYTRPQNLRLTPEYSSPEQIRQQTVTTASDVYSLGSVLYELLTGRQVFDLKEATAGSMERIICEQEPVAPSEVVTDSHRVRRLRGDLDVIILKTLQKEPSRRYLTVSALADDLQRHMDGLPVEAQPDSNTYRLGKFVRRHRVGVAAAALLLMVILAGMGGTLWQASEARYQGKLAEEQRDRALQAATRAETVTDFMTSMFEGADPYITGGDTLNVFDLLEDGRLRVDEELADNPAAQAALLMVMGHAYINLGQYSLSDSLLIRSQKLTASLPNPDPLDEAEILNSRAMLAGYEGDNEQARSLHRQALALRRQSLGNISRPVAASLTSLGVNYMYQGFPDSAVIYLNEAEAIRSQLPETPPLERAGGLSNLASAYQGQGDFAGADSLFAVTAEIIRENAPPGHPNLATLLNNWGILNYHMENYEAARDHLQESKDIYESTLGADHPHTVNAAGNLNAVLKKLE